MEKILNLEEIFESFYTIFGIFELWEYQSEKG